MDYDVAIIGGGPAGSTCGSLLRKYDPSLKVLILEREVFPRDHIGESQLPMICPILEEMGCWDKVEAADFPIKIGATYRWGNSDKLWDFEFLPGTEFESQPRPAKFEGQRRQTAFQVDRSIYDKILLDHAGELGCEVRQGVKVTKVHHEGDKVLGFELASGETVTADHYVDCSGDAAILRKALDVPIDCPTSLRNIAIWDYWQNADWAVKIGVGGTRIQIMSLDYGWIWFIPMGPTRTSIGLVIPAETYKKSGKSPLELYLKAVAEEPHIGSLLSNAVREEKLASTKDWSFVAERIAGENWFLAGECAGFADPILSAGMTLAHTAGREVAYTILELRRKEHDPAWLISRYDDVNRKRIGAHVKFADFWYAGNGIFTDLQAYTSEIAKDSGLALTADEAFRWLSTGGFAHDNYLHAQVATWDVGSMKVLAQRFMGTTATWQIGQNNLFDLDLEGAERDFVPILEDGRIHKVRCYTRSGKSLPNFANFRAVIFTLRTERYIEDIIAGLMAYYKKMGLEPRQYSTIALQTLEAMVTEGWVKASVDPERPLHNFLTPEESQFVHENRDWSTEDRATAVASEGVK